jgi:spermidine synthase
MIATLIPTVVLERVQVPGGELVLSKRGDELSIRVRGVELMSSRNHDSEDELGRRAAALCGDGKRVLVGGLGLGFTLRAVLDNCRAAIDVVELVPAVVRWNRTHAAHLANHPLDDPRVTVIEDDVAAVIASAKASYDAIVLDVDNGPDELFDSNRQLYRRNGLAAARRALVPGGGLAVWSSFESSTFETWLREVGFSVETVRIKARGARHVIWLARSR